jgi:hypothetical protein
VLTLHSANTNGTLGCWDSKGLCRLQIPCQLWSGCQEHGRGREDVGAASKEPNKQRSGLSEQDLGPCHGFGGQRRQVNFRLLLTRVEKMELQQLFPKAGAIALAVL